MIKKRDAREEMITDEEIGSLFIDDKYKEEGFTYRIVDADRPNRVTKLQKMGYTIVENPSIQTGDKTITNTGQLGATVHFQLGVEHSRNGILMRIPTDLYEKRQERKVRQNNEVMEGLSNSGIPTQTGKISIN